MWPREMLALADVRLDPSTAQLFVDVDEALEQVRSLGEFSPELRERISLHFLPDRISDTLVIESIYVNARLTRAVLEGQAVADVDAHGLLAVENVNDANMLMEHEARQGRPMTVQLVREINRKIVEGTGEVRDAGAFRDFDVSITGASMQPPDWTLLLDAMQDFEKQVEAADAHPIEIAAWAHWVVARLHPFENGNGRTARLVQDFFLIRGGFIPVGVPAGKRSEYYDALALADSEQDLGALVSIIADAELFALEKTYNLAKEEEVTRQRVAEMARQVQGKSVRQQASAYQIWLRRMEILGDELERLIGDWNGQGTGVVFRFDRYELKSQDKWQEIQDVGWARNTWFMRIKVLDQGRPRLQILLYLRRHRIDWIAESTEELSNSVAVFVDVRDADQEFRLGNQFDDDFVSLREIAVDSHGYWIFEPAVFKDGTVAPDVKFDGDRKYWTGHHVDHLAPTLTTFMEHILDRLGARD